MMPNRWFDRSAKQRCCLVPVALRASAPPHLHRLACRNMSLDDLTVNFGHLDRAELLSDWQWLLGTTKLPILVTAAGDTFVQDTEDNSVHFLDVASGELKRVAESPDEFSSLLEDRDFVMGHFSVELIADLRQAGRTLEPGQLYSFKKPTVLGGEYVLNNFEPASIEVHFSLLGQIHEQVRKLPPGTKIKGVQLK
jgi:hypothetical protein